MLDKIIAYLFSFSMMTGAIWGLYLQQRNSLFFDSTGLEAIVGSIVSFIISFIYFSNLLNPKIKWLKAKDWPFFMICILAEEIVLHYLFVFLSSFPHS